MRPFFYVCLIFIQSQVMSQSPYLSVSVKMDPAKTDLKKYKIQMKICEPKKMSEKSDWFTPDTSAINFATLKAEEITCGGYYEKGMPAPVSGTEQEQLNSYQFGNQVFAWEKILVFKISDFSSRGRHPEMYLVLPIKYKSFVTLIDISDIDFFSGKVVFLTDANAFYDENHLNIRQSLKDVKTLELKAFQLKELLEQK